jgi:ribosomal protein S6 kinase alpha-5
VYLVRKIGGVDDGKLYAMKVIRKSKKLKKKDIQRMKTERNVLEKAGCSRFLVRLHYAFQTDRHLHLVMGEYIKLYTLLENRCNSMCKVLIALRILYPMAGTIQCSLLNHLTVSSLLQSFTLQLHCCQVACTAHYSPQIMSCSRKECESCGVARFRKWK